MHLRFCLKALFLLFLPLLAFSDPWISGKEEFKVKKLEYLSIKNQFSIDTSAYPIPLALIRNPNEDMFNNMSLMNEYIDYANKIISKESKKYINEFGFSSNSEFNPFRYIDSKFKDKNSFFFSSSYLGDRFAAKAVSNSAVVPVTSETVTVIKPVVLLLRVIKSAAEIVWFLSLIHI